MALTYVCILNWPLPIGAFQDHWNKLNSHISLNSHVSGNLGTNWTETTRKLNELRAKWKDLCRKQFLGDEDRDALQRKVGDLQMAWDELRTEAIEKETM